MTKFKLFLAAAALMLGGAHVNAQNSDDSKNYKPYPYMFVGIHGGAQTTFTNYDMTKLVTPVTGVSFGSYFTPSVGVRLHVNGWQNKGGIKSLNQTYEYNSVTSNLDLMLNLTNLFSKKDNHVFNVILIGGIGLNYAWENDDLMNIPNYQSIAPLAWKDDRLSHNARVGVQFDLNLAKHFGLNLEIAANSLSDRYNSKTNSKDDWKATASLGLVYKFGFKKKPVPPAPVEEWATRIDTVWYDDVTYKDIAVPVKLESNIYYKITLTEPEPKSKIEEIVKFIKENKNCKIVVTGYADKGTGNPKLNMGYSKNRAEKVTKALVEAGISASTITTSYKGDTVQPFAENDLNRVAITVVTGEGTQKEKVVTKKFRTEEVRYRVK